ncbi:protein of unknown function [Brochothrix thermosphacta]|nr:protein of unknown function [Brochothrix thermosphacta]
MFETTHFKNKNDNNSFVSARVYFFYKRVNSGNIFHFRLIFYSIY